MEGNRPVKIFLIGLPGSGKTSLGRELAKVLQLPFVDLDREIEHRENRSIPSIFKDLKEPYFRQVESSELQRWCANEQSFVMATGGGAPCFHDNMDRINQAGISVFLDVPTREIARRMMQSKLEQRPLLHSVGVDGVKDQIEFLRSSRIAFYRQAQLTMQGEEITAQEVVPLLPPAIAKK